MILSDLIIINKIDSKIILPTKFTFKDESNNFFEGENGYFFKSLEFAEFNIPIIKGLNVKNKLNLTQLTSDFEDICDILLFDAPSETLPGGNGKKFDWDILKDFKSKKKWMLAGGLNIENIENAIDITKAPAIDISSGLEIKKGLKDSQLIKDFVIKCRNL